MNEVKVVKRYRKGSAQNPLKFKAICPPAFYGGKTYLDGKLVHNLRSFKVEGAVDGITKVTLGLIAVDVDLEAEGWVEMDLVEVEIDRVAASKAMLADMGARFPEEPPKFLNSLEVPRSEFEAIHPDLATDEEKRVRQRPDPQAFVPGFNIRNIELENACSFLQGQGWSGFIPFDEAVKALVEDDDDSGDSPDA